jgi:hypothetical protein
MFRVRRLRAEAWSHPLSRTAFPASTDRRTFNDELFHINSGVPPLLRLVCSRERCLTLESLDATLANRLRNGPAGGGEPNARLFVRRLLRRGQLLRRRREQTLLECSSGIHQAGKNCEFGFSFRRD